MRRIGWIGVVCALAGLAIPAAAHTVDRKFWMPNGRVNTIVVSGNMVYIGGAFTMVGPAGGGPGVLRENLAALDATTGVVTDWNPGANDEVLALAARGGTIYTAGRFTAVGGQSRTHIAALDGLTGGVTAWNPNPTRTPQQSPSVVTALAVSPSGGTIYVAGVFDHIGGQTRIGIAALDANSGQATPCVIGHAKFPIRGH